MGLVCSQVETVPRTVLQDGSITYSIQCLLSEVLAILWGLLDSRKFSSTLNKYVVPTAGPWMISCMRFIPV